MIAYLTEHSRGRLKGRVGIPKRAHRRMAKIVMQRGMMPDFATGDFKVWIYGVALRSGGVEEDVKNVILRIHGYELYIFRKCRHTRSRNAYALLITVMNIPKNFRRFVDLARAGSDPVEKTGT